MGRDLFRGLEIGYAREMNAAEWPAPDLSVPGVGGSPLAGAAPGMAGLGIGGAAVINVYPQAGQDEQQIAAMVSRELAWAAAGGMA